MASEYTSHYNLDLYTDNDKPNLRDQYNGAINKIDAQMYTISTNTTTANATSNTALENASVAKKLVETAQNTANTAVSNAASAQTAANKAQSSATAAQSTADNALSTAKTAQATADTANKNIDKTTTTIFGKSAYTNYDDSAIKDSNNLITSGGVFKAIDEFSTSSFLPITSANLAPGAVIANKLASSAVASIQQGIEVKCFGNSAAGADNTGASFPNGVYIAGFYIPALDILSIWQLSIAKDVHISSSNPITLPNYIPNMTYPANAKSALLAIGCILWTGTSNFDTWYGGTINGRNLYYGEHDVSQAVGIPFTMSCAPYRTSKAMTVSTLSAVMNNNAALGK